MKVVSLFSGTGALDLGLQQAGHEIIMQVEQNPYCVQVLQHHFPGVELQRTIASVSNIPEETELLAAGFPCEVSSFVTNCRRTCRHVFL